MSNTEKKIEDTQGKYLHAIKGGRELTDAEWENCRIVLTNQRLMIVTDSKISVPLEEIDVLDERVDVNRNAASESYYTALDIGDDVLLITTADFEGFRTNFFRAILDEAVIYVKHPAIVGGVVKASEWQRGRLKVTKDTVRMVLEDGQKFIIERDDIGEMEVDEREVAGEERGVIEVEHTDEEGTSVETYLSGRQYHISVLKQLLEEGAERNRADLDLTATEQRVVMALYSGVSPFAISDFVGIDVERVEEIYDELIELDVIRVVRERKEVSLTPQGRKVAGEAMGEQ
ncbi:chemotaxis protein CheF1 [Halovenus sp. WSH3]|uniref:Taxis protein CheF n=1 Tax=Halovenus carboxidivorans TaxID=2692199 RepID=A0A6B0T6N8_9EURY|nr:CheF family chemotaxis protein [Halovenus carboxidivorans]MXR50550.1 chemotaxis protein CheF1 [Halovenus carboxidivorans]